MLVAGVGMGVLGIAFADGLRKFDWCPESRWQIALLLAGVGGMTGGLTGIPLGWFRLQRYHALKDFAASESGEFIEKASARLTERTKNLLGKIGVAALTDVMKLVAEDHRTSLWIGDLSVDGMGENRRVERRTIAAFQYDGFVLPQFLLQPRRFGLGFLRELIGLQDIRFTDYPRFSDMYHLSGRVQNPVKQLFYGSLLDHFDVRKGWEAAGEGDWLIIAAPRRRHLSAAGRRHFLNQVREVFSLFATACCQVDTSEAPQETDTPEETDAPEGLLHGLLGALVSDSEATAFLEQPVPRSVPEKIVRPHMIPVLFSAVFGVFFLVAGGIAVITMIHLSWLVALSILPGSSLLWFAWWWRGRRLRLLRHGQVTSGTIRSIHRSSLYTSTTRYRVRVCYEVRGAVMHSVVAVSGDMIEEIWQAQDGDRQVSLIYDPQTPRHCLLACQLATNVHAHPSTRRTPDAAGESEEFDN